MAATVLIVDDEESIRRSVGDILVDEGYQAESAGNAEEALRKIEAQGFAFLEEVEIPGFEENYFLRFKRK